MAEPLYTRDDYLAALLALLPRGRVWPKDPDAAQSSVLAGLAPTFERLDARAQALIVDAFPGTTVELLSDWEASLGLPDPCEGESQGLEQRRGQVVNKLASAGGQSVAYFLSVVARLGYTGASITQYAPFRVGRDVVGSPLYGADWAFAWTLNLPDLRVFYFQAGISAAGEPLLSISNDVALCVIEALAPAQTTVIFTNDGAGFALAAASGSFALTGSASGGVAPMAAAPGIFALTGFAAADPTDTSGWTVLHADDSTKPMSVRLGPAVTVQGGFNWGPFSQVGQEAAAATGNYVFFEWTDGFATADPYNGSGAHTRRDDQTVAPNFVASSVKVTGYVAVERDTAAGVTKLKVRRRANTVLASDAQFASGETRSDGTFLGALISMQHALYGPPPYEMIWIGATGPASTVQEYWSAFWTREADSHQSDIDPTQRVGETVTPGAHVEQDAWERTGVSTETHETFINHLYQPTTGTASDPLVGDGAYTPDLGSAVSDGSWDIRLLVLSDRTLNYLRPNGASAWTLYRTFVHPADSRFPTAPVFMQIDAKAGFRASDNPGWVRSVDGTTPDWEWSFKSLEVRTPASNAANWTNHTIDPATIPAMSVAWVVTTTAIDNSAPNGTVLANLTAAAGFTYQVFGCSGMAVVGNQVQISGIMPAGGHDVTVWATRTSDGALFVVATTQVTVLDNAVWWDANAKVDLNFESQQVRLLGVAGVWSDYVDVSGHPTATLQAMLPGFAATGVVVFKGAGAAADAADGLYGYSEPTNTGQFVMQIALANPFQAVAKSSDNLELRETVAGMAASSDPFGIGISWAAAGMKFCGNGGTVGSTAAAFATASASNPLLWNDGFGDRAFSGTKQRITLYDPDHIGGTAGALVSDAQLQAVAVPA